jgi:hypothetical protein
MVSDFKFYLGEPVLIDGKLGEVVATTRFKDAPNAYQVQFVDSSRWFAEDMISRPTIH